jgi:hypothetical protein
MVHVLNKIDEQHRAVDGCKMVQTRYR